MDLRQSQVHRPEAASGAVSNFWPTTSGKLANMVTSQETARYGDAVVEELNQIRKAEG